MQLEFNALSQETLVQSLPQRYFDFHRLLMSADDADRNRNQATLVRLTSKIAGAQPPSSWEPDLSNGLLEAVLPAARAALLDQSLDALPTETQIALVERATWLCSFSMAAGTTLALQSRLDAAGLWLLTQLIASLPDDAEAWIDTATQVLTPLDLPQQDLGQRARAELVVGVARRLKADLPVDSVCLVTSRQWALDLHSDRKLRSIVAGELDTLSVQWPELAAAPRQSPDPARLQRNLTDLYFDLSLLVTRYGGQWRAANQALTAEIGDLISRNVPINTWNSALLTRLVNTYCALSREALLVAGFLAPDSSDGTAATRRCEWLCELVESARESITLSARQQTCGLWVMTQLRTAKESVDFPSWLESAKARLGSLPVPESDIIDQAKAQMVLHAAATLRAGRQLDRSAAELAWAWSQELREHPTLSKLLRDAHGTIAESVGPYTSIADPPGFTHVAEGPTSPTAVPRIWQSPVVLPAASLAAESRDCRDQLMALMNRRPDLLRERTGRLIGALGPNSTLETGAAAFYWASRDLWSAYWSGRDTSVLGLAQRLALAVYSHHTLKTGTISTVRSGPDHRSNALYLWMVLQLPQWVAVHDLEELLEDARLLCAAEGCRVGDMMLREGIVEAVAAECRRLAEDGDIEARNRFLADNSDFLKRVHDDYQREESRRKVPELPDDYRNEERRAWEYMYPEQTLAPAGNDLPGGPSILAGSFREDPAFAQIIKSGNHDAVRDFISNHREEIQAGLQRRLDVRLSAERVVEPEGMVFEPGGKKYQPEPRFVLARDALTQGDHVRAAELFKQLSDRVQGRGREIARNYQAYAMAKQGDMIEARGLLIDLTKARFPFSSAYWNLACCYPEMELQKKLDILALGLEVAPDTRLLSAGVFLASLLDDQKHLADWLPLLALTEAMMLLYGLEYEATDFDGREQSLRRLRDYLRDGEPLVPDPTMERLNNGEVNNFITAMVDRHQEAAVDFWLKCRESDPRFRSRFDFWQIKTDYLERTQRHREAAAAFREELGCRLGYLERGLTQGQRLDNWTVTATRSRATKWLRQCMTPELKGSGQDLYNALVAFHSRRGTPDGLGSLLPGDSRIHDYYGGTPPPPQPISPPPVRTAPTQSTPGLADPQRSAGNPPSPSRLNLEQLIINAGSDCGKMLVDVSDLSRVQQQLEGLVTGLNSGGAVASATALTSLLHEWQTHRQPRTVEERLASLQRANSAHAELTGALETDLRPQQRTLATPLMNALMRVNQRLARTLGLLPKLSISPLEPGPAPVYRNERCGVFVLRVGSPKGSQPVLLKRGEGLFLESLRAVQLRDDLAASPALVSPDQSALLTFEVPSDIDTSQPSLVQVELLYEFEGFDYKAEAIQVPLLDSSVPPIPSRNAPYLYGRALEPGEIEEHFFGRTLEQQAILDSVSHGQQKLRYVEGIRRVGKSSLLNSVMHLIEQQDLQLIPVRIGCASVSALDHPGKILHYLLAALAKHPMIAASGVSEPTEARCIENAPSAYLSFLADLATKLPDRRVFAMLDDFQELAKWGAALSPSDRALMSGLVGILNLIHEQANTNARLLWVFAGQITLNEYKRRLGGALMWATMKPLPVDFLSVEAVGEIIRKPLSAMSVVVPPETVARSHFLTGGHPETVQQVAESMFLRAVDEGRAVLTPNDADMAAQEVVATSDNYADTWYPESELSEDQKAFMAAFVKAVPVGGSIEVRRLAPDHQVTERLDKEVKDLAGRKILTLEAGVVQVRARVLDMWLHKYIPMTSTRPLTGSVALFVDVANLTSGSGADVIGGLATEAGDDGTPGRFRLTSVLRAISRHGKSLSDLPIARQWAINYPKNSPAVMICNAEEYLIENIPYDLYRKGSDDITLRHRVEDVEFNYPSVHYYVIVTGDVDYSLTIYELLKKGKSVHVVARAASMSDKYRQFAREYPRQCKAIDLESLLTPTPPFVRLE